MYVCVCVLVGVYMCVGVSDTNIALPNICLWLIQINWCNLKVTVYNLSTMVSPKRLEIGF